MHSSGRDSRSGPDTLNWYHTKYSGFISGTDGTIKFNQNKIEIEIKNKIKKDPRLFRFLYGHVYNIAPGAIQESFETDKNDAFV